MSKELKSKEKPNVATNSDDMAYQEVLHPVGIMPIPKFKLTKSKRSLNPNRTIEPCPYNYNNLCVIDSSYD